jgi:hypothetical protein
MVLRKNCKRPKVKGARPMAKGERFKVKGARPMAKGERFKVKC